MRSRLFRVVLEDPQSDSAKTFVRDLKELLSLDSDGRTKCVAALPRLLGPRTEFQTRQLVEEIADSTHADPRSIENSLSILHFFVDALLSDTLPKDDYKNWGTDLVDLKVISETDRQVFELTIQPLVNRREELQIRAREGAASGGVTPAFKSLGATVEARAVKNGRYHWGTPVDGYTPQIMGITYIASVHIGLDEGSPQDFYFQLSESDVDNIITSLTAVKKEILALRKHIEEGGR